MWLVINVLSFGGQGIYKSFTLVYRAVLPSVRMVVLEKLTMWGETRLIHKLLT